MPSQIIHGQEVQPVTIKKSFTARYCWLILVSLYVLIVGVVSSLFFNGTQTQNARTAEYFAWCLISLFFLFALSAAGPSEVQLDPKHRRYTLTKGSILKAKTVHGPIEDIAAVVCEIKTARGAVYELRIDWNISNRKSTFITYTTMENAYAILDEVTTKLHVPTRWDDKT